MSDRRIEFRLGGANYTLSSQDVKDRLEHTAPGPVDKYLVRINGRDYPPKQVISIALGISPDKFISTDATRILRNLGFKIRRRGERPPVIKTESEELFEAYLRSNRLTDFHFEAAQEETSSRPDYELYFRGESILFEVKQFEATRDDYTRGFGQFDPYALIREKINAARSKFSGIENRCCCLVIYNCGKPLLFLSWEFIYAAMLGNLAFQLPFDPNTLTSDTKHATWGFADRGKMHRHDAHGRPVGPQNTTISAVLVLEQFGVGKRRFDLDVRRREKETGRSLGLEERLTLVDQSRGTERDWSFAQTRIAVHENPYTGKPLRRDLFLGNYDERYGEKDGSIQRIFVGEQILALEAQEQSVKSIVTTDR